MMSVYIKCAKCKQIMPFEFAEEVAEKNLFEIKFLWLCVKCFKKYNKLKIRARTQEIKIKAKESVKNERKCNKNEFI